MLRNNMRKKDILHNMSMVTNAARRYRAKSEFGDVVGGQRSKFRGAVSVSFAVSEQRHGR